MTLTEVVTATGLSRRTTESVLDALQAGGSVECLDASNPLRSVGRPARTFRFRQEAGLCMGISVGRREIGVMLADLSGGAVLRDSQPIRARASRDERIAAVIGAARAALAGARRPRKDLRAVAVGTPGVVAQDGRVTLCNTLTDWKGFDLRGPLERWTRCPVIVENDVNLSARGEQWRGAAEGLESVVWVLTGRQTRAAIIIDGALYRGADGAAGEIGWLPVLGWPEVEECALSYHRARHGIDADPAREALAEALARGLAALVLTINPECLVLGGVCAGDDLPLVKAVQRHLQPWCLQVPDVRTSTLGQESTALGAVRVALDVVQADLFSVR